MIRNFIGFFAGKKTYIVGILMIVLGYLQGNNDFVLQGVAVMTTRAAISKI